MSRGGREVVFGIILFVLIAPIRCTKKKRKKEELFQHVSLYVSCKQEEGGTMIRPIKEVAPTPGERSEIFVFFRVHQILHHDTKSAAKSVAEEEANATRGQN